MVDRPTGDTGSCTLVHDVSVSLISQVADLQFIAGADLRIGVSFFAPPMVGVAGEAFTLALSVDPGAPTVTPPGADLTITVSLTAGAATTP